VDVYIILYYIILYYIVNIIIKYIICMYICANEYLKYYASVGCYVCYSYIIKGKNVIKIND
jgi:hypothetical protein